MTIRIERRARAGVLTIARPAVRNAVDGPTAAALAGGVAELEADTDVDVLVLTGAGGTFCAGADLHAMSDPARRNRLERALAGPMGPTRGHPSKPVIAAVEGHAVAGGLELALWCDLRVVADDAVLGVFCRRWGVPLIDGGTVRLPRLVGYGRALDLAAELSRFPQRTLRADLASARAAFDRPLPEALLAEHDGGIAAIEAGGMADVARFVAGEGRHGHPSADHGR